MADDDDLSAPGPNIPQDRDLRKPLSETNPPIENKKGKLVSKPDTQNLGEDDAVTKLPSLDRLEREIASTFFKGPSQTRDQVAAGLLSGSFERLRDKSRGFAKKWDQPSGSSVKLTPVQSADTTASMSGGSRTSSPFYMGLVAAGTQAQIEQVRLFKAYQLPYMKRNLALAYLRTNYAKQQLGLTDQLRRDLLAKLDTVKTNLAVPDAAKGSLFQKIRAETMRQTIARVSSSIQDIGFQYANRFYTGTVTRKAAAIRDRLANGAGLRDLVSETAAQRSKNLLRRAAAYREKAAEIDPSSSGNRALQNYYTTRRRMALSGARRASGLVTAHRGMDLGGRLLSPVADFASRYNPFNKNIFTPVAVSGTGNDFVSEVDGTSASPGSSKTPLFYAFTGWVKEYRHNQQLLIRAIQGEKVDAKDVARGNDPVKAALKSWSRENKRTTKSADTEPSQTTVGGFFKSFFKSDQFKDVKDSLSDEISDEAPTPSKAGGVKGFVDDVWQHKRRDVKNALRRKGGRPKPTIPTEPTSENDTSQSGPGFFSYSIKDPFVDGVKKTTGLVASTLFPGKSTTVEPYGPITLKDGYDAYHVSDAVANRHMGPGRKGFFDRIRNSGLATEARTKATDLIDSAYTERRKLGKTKKGRVSDFTNTLADDTESVSPSTIQNVLRVAAGMGLIVAPYALKRLSSKTAQTAEEVGNRSVKDDLTKGVTSLGDRITEGLSAIAQSQTGQSIKNNDRVQEAGKHLSRGSRRALLYGRKGLRYAQRSKIGQAVEDHIGSIPFYNDVMNVVSPRTLGEKIIGKKRSHMIDRDLSKLGNMNYKTLGRLGIGLATGSGTLAAARYAYRLARGRDTTGAANQLRTYFGVKGLDKATLISKLADPIFAGVVSEGDRKRLEMGETLHRVLSGRQMGQISKIFRAESAKGSNFLAGASRSLGDRFSDYVGKRVSPGVGTFVKGMTGTGVDEAAKVVGSLTDNLQSLGRVIGIRPKDNIFTRYTKGLESINNEVKSTGGIFKNLAQSVFSKDSKARRTHGLLAAGSIAARLGARYLRRKLTTANRDQIIADGIANRSPIEKATRTGLLTARNVFFNPDRYTREEFVEHQAELKDKKQARKDRRKRSAEAFRQLRANLKEKRLEKIAQRKAEAARKKDELKAAKNPTLTSLLLSRLGIGPAPRAGSWKEQMKQRDLERRGAWYSWRRAMGRRNLKGDDIHKYSDRFGLFGSVMDTGAGFGNSLIGSLAGSALGLAGRGAMGVARLGYRGTRLGIDAARTYGLRGAAKVGGGALSAVGGGLKMAGGLLKGPLGIGLIAHEMDQGFAENTTGATRRIGTTASKMAEYGAMGAFFGPWGIAIGAGVGALVANMDYVSKAVKGVGNAVGTVAKPLWNATKAVSRAAWDVTKFTGRVIGTTWTTIFGRGAKYDKNGKVTRLEKNSLLGDMRVAFFGQKPKYDQSGQLISASKRSMFGVVHDGFTKTFFGDKFSNGAYKPGTSLVDMAWDGLKNGISATAKFFTRLPGEMWGMLKKGMGSLWDGLKNVGGKIRDTATNVKNKVVNTGRAIGRGAKKAWDVTTDIASHLTPMAMYRNLKNLPKNARSTAAYLAHHGRELLGDAKRSIARNTQFARQHPILEAADLVTGAMHAATYIPGATPLVGAAAASSKWIINNAQTLSPDSPVSRLMRASLAMYGVDNLSMYSFIHQIEVDEDKIADGKMKQYNDEDLKWMAGQFGLDPKNTDSVNYFVTWFNNRFIPMFQIVRGIVRKYKLTMDNVLNASNEHILAVAKEIEQAKKSIPAGVASLKPTLADYKKLSDDAKKRASTTNPTTIRDSSDGSAVTGKPNTQNTKPSQSGSSSGTPSDGGVNDPTPAGSQTATPSITPGNITDQKEYKAAYQLLANDVKAFVDKDKSLQFTLWAESVQDGPQKTAHTFNTEYRAGETSKNFRADIYQDRGQHFTENTGPEQIAAMRKLYDEQQFSNSIGDGANPTLDQMGNAIGHPIVSQGNGTVSPFSGKNDSLGSGRQPRGIRNNNPGNINFNHQPGAVLETGTPSPRFAKFQSPELGIRAAMLNLQSYQKRGLQTVYQMINRWAPAEENPAVGSYINNVSGKLGVTPNTPINTQDPNVLATMVDAISRVENGKNPWASKDAQVAKAVADGTSTVEDPLGDQSSSPPTSPTSVVRNQPTDSASGGYSEGSSITRGESDRIARGDGGGSAGDPTSPTGSSSGTPGTSGDKSAPTAITASVDQSPVVSVLNDIHSTLKSQGQQASQQIPSVTRIQNTDPTAPPAPVQSGPQSVLVNHITNVQNPGGGQDFHAKAVDMSLKKTAVLAGTTA